MPLTPEQKQAIETLSGIPKADHEEFANELRGTAKPLFQVVFDSGFSSAEGRYKPRADAAEKRAEEAEAKAPTGDVLVLKGDDKARWEVAAPLLPAKPDEIKAAVILTGDKLAKWQKVEPLDLDDLTIRAGKAEELERKDAERTRTDLIAKGVKAEGWDESTTATIAALLAGAKVEPKAGKVKDKDGKEIDGEVMFVTLPGEGQQPVRLGELPKTVETFKFVERVSAAPENKGAHFPPEPLGGGVGKSETPPAARGRVNYRI